MGRHKLSHLTDEAERMKREKIESEINKFDEGEGEEFCVKVVKVSNGFIVQHEKGQLVFNHDTYGAMLEFIVHRRLKSMEPGEEIDIELRQIFTKRVDKGQTE